MSLLGKRPRRIDIAWGPFLIKNHMDKDFRRGDPRKHPRVRLTLAVECRLLDSEKFWPGRPLEGEITDVSIGGARAGLPERLPRFKEVEVTAVIEGRLFRGRAEIVGTDAEARRDSGAIRYRHSLCWVRMDAHSKEALTRVLSGAV